MFFWDVTWWINVVKLLERIVNTVYNPHNKCLKEFIGVSDIIVHLVGGLLSIHVILVCLFNRWCNTLSSQRYKHCRLKPSYQDCSLSIWRILAWSLAKEWCCGKDIGSARLHITNFSRFQWGVSKAQVGYSVDTWQNVEHVPVYGHCEPESTLCCYRIFSHPNVLPVVGCCNSPPNLVVINQYMAWGSLYTLLHEGTGVVVDTVQALRFALDVARGMAFLHSLERIIPEYHLNSRHIMVRTWNYDWESKTDKIQAYYLYMPYTVCSSCGLCCNTHIHVYSCWPRWWLCNTWGSVWR